MRRERHFEDKRSSGSQRRYHGYHFKTILGKESLSKGIKINQSEEGVSLDVYVIVDYGVKIPVVAWDIQTNVKNELETMTDRPVLAVNIHVQGVQENDTEEEQK